MTTEDKKKIIQACKLVKEVYPNICGYFRINLHPEREKCNYNVYYSGDFSPKEYFED